MNISVRANSYLGFVWALFGNIKNCHDNKQLLNNNVIFHDNIVVNSNLFRS